LAALNFAASESKGGGAPLSSGLCGVGMPLIATKPLVFAYRGRSLIFLKFFWKFGRHIKYRDYAGGRANADVSLSEANTKHSDNSSQVWIG
jgi:hypothetical protein